MGIQHFWVYEGEAEGRWGDTDEPCPLRKRVCFLREVGREPPLGRWDHDQRLNPYTLRSILQKLYGAFQDLGRCEEEMYRLYPEIADAAKVRQAVADAAAEIVLGGFIDAGVLRDIEIRENGHSKIVAPFDDGSDLPLRF